MRIFARTLIPQKWMRRIHRLGLPTMEKLTAPATLVCVISSPGRTRSVFVRLDLRIQRLGLSALGQIRLFGSMHD